MAFASHRSIISGRLGALNRVTRVPVVPRGIGYVRGRRCLLHRPVYSTSAKWTMASNKLSFEELFQPASSLSRYDPLMAAPPIVYPFLALFKSSTLLKVSTVIAKSSLTILASIRWWAHKLLRWWHGPSYDATLSPSSDLGGSSASNSQAKPKHFRRTTWFLISFPIILLATGLVVSLERTPIWGRWRVIMLSQAEEVALREGFLAPGESPNAGQRNWLAILRNVFQENASDPGSLQGGSVLDPKVDWRAKWVEDVLRKLENAIDKCDLTSQSLVGLAEDSDGSVVLHAPPVKYPLTARCTISNDENQDSVPDDRRNLLTKHGCVVVDSPSFNAMSLGFGPLAISRHGVTDEAPGVIVVYTGA